MTDIVEKIARAIMDARNGSKEGDCQVQNWKREQSENTHVEQAIRQAKAVIAALADSPLDERALKVTKKYRTYGGCTTTE